MLAAKGEFYTLYLSGAKTGWALTEMRPYLHGLSEHADIAIELAKTIGCSREIREDGSLGRIMDVVDIDRVEMQANLRHLRGPIDVELPSNGTRAKRKAWAPDPTATEEDFAWAAGIVDGDGCITITKRTYESGTHNFFPVLKVSVENGRIIRKLREILGGTVVRRTGKPLSYHSWVVNGGYVETVLSKLRPYLIAKKAQADVVASFVKTMKKHGGPISLSVFGERVNLYKEIRLLNAMKNWHAERPTSEMRPPKLAASVK